MKICLAFAVGVISNFVDVDAAVDVNVWFIYQISVYWNLFTIIRFFC